MDETGRRRRRRSGLTSLSCLALGVAALAGSAPAVAAVEFQPARNFVVGAAPSSIAVGDLNGDGNPDAVVANRDSDSLSVLLGDGAGGIIGTATVGTGAGTAPVAVALADFDADQRLDVVVADSGADQVGLLPNDGTGVLMPPTNFPLPVGSHPSALAVGDFNRDSRPDVAVTNQFPGNVSVLVTAPLGGTFLPATLFRGTAVTRMSPRAIVTGLFNDDDVVDLAVSTATGAATLHGIANRPSFESAASVLFLQGSGSTGLATGDMNGDGRADLVVPHYGVNRVTVMLGDGLGAFAVSEHEPVTGRPTAVALGDLDRDNKQDVVVVSQASNTVATLLGDGAGGLAPPVHIGAGEMPSAIAVADFNKDGFPDLLVANSGDDNVSLLLARIPGSAPPPPPAVDLKVSQAGSPGQVVVGGQVTYTATITNAGPGAAPGVTLLGTLPAGSTLVSVKSPQGPCVADAPGVRCEIGALAPGASATATVVVRTGVQGQVSNGFTASVAGRTDPTPADNTAVVATRVVPAPRVKTSSVLRAPARFALGRRASYTVVLRCSRACRATASARLVMRPARGRVPAVRTRVTPARGTTLRVVMDLRRARGAIIAALARRARVQLVIDVRPRDNAGAMPRVRKTIRVTR